jgi:thioredoxin-related protein
LHIIFIYAILFQSGVRMKKLLTVCALAVFLLVSGCASSQPTWLSNFDEAKQLAEKNNKRIFLLFSADETDEASAELRKNVFDTKELQKALKEYVLVNLDFSESRYTAADVAEDADEETKATAEAMYGLLMADMDVAQKYSLQGLPTAYLLTKEGYVLAGIQIAPEITTVTQFITLLDEQKEQIDAINALLSRIDSSADVIDKALAINDLYEATEVQYRPLLADFFKKVPELDPDNTSGILGKFLLQAAYVSAMDFFAIGDLDSAIGEFLTISENPTLSQDEKQEALFSAAYFMAQSGYGSIDTVLGYLADALATSPDSENAPVIAEIIQGLQAQAAEEAAAGE